MLTPNEKSAVHSTFTDMPWSSRQLQELALVLLTEQEPELSEECTAQAVAAALEGR